jgi:hypothetical protein
LPPKRWELVKPGREATSQIAKLMGLSGRARMTTCIGCPGISKLR